MLAILTNRLLNNDYKLITYIVLWKGIHFEWPYQVSEASLQEIPEVLPKQEANRIDIYWLKFTAVSPNSC